MSDDKCHCGHSDDDHTRRWTSSDTSCSNYFCDCKRFLSSTVTHNVCEYCWTHFPLRTRKYESRPHAVQPRACCTEHSARLRAWDGWITKSRSASLHGRKEPAMPKLPSTELLQGACV